MTAPARTRPYDSSKILSIAALVLPHSRGERGGVESRPSLIGQQVILRAFGLA